MAKINNCEDLEVWQLGIALVKEIYRITERFPDKERFRLTDQLCRAAISIPSNIAEGSSRKTTKEYMRYTAIANGSRAELRTQLIIAVELGYMSKADPVFQLTEILGKKLNALYAALERKIQ